MKTIYVRKIDNGFQYRENNWCAFSHCPDSVKDIKSLNNFFTENGRFDPVNIQFVKDDKSIVSYIIKKGKDFAVCDYDNSKRVDLNSYNFVSETEQIEFLKIHSDRKTDALASKIPSEHERLSFYKRFADESTLAGLQEFVNSKVTDAAKKEFCIKHARQFYDCDAEVIFE